MLTNSSRYAKEEEKEKKKANGNALIIKLIELKQTNVKSKSPTALQKQLNTENISFRKNIPISFIENMIKRKQNITKDAPNSLSKSTVRDDNMAIKRKSLNLKTLFGQIASHGTEKNIINIGENKVKDLSSKRSKTKQHNSHSKSKGGTKILMNKWINHKDIVTVSFDYNNKDKNFTYG